MEELPGKGIRACVDGKQVLCGNAALLEAFGIAPCPVPISEGTLVLVAVDGAAAGWIRIADTLKPDAAQAVKQLHDMGIATAMLTGDAETTARQIAAHTGIQAIHPRLLPGEKLEVLQTLRNDKGATMFVGDGINDAPVLSGADVGAAMGSGADAAIEAADVVFMTNAVCAIPQSIQIARRTKAVAWQNVIFALGIKAIVMVLGLCGGASMWMAVFADSGVAMLCVLNSIRQLYRKSIG
jgi:Cd2+/Zn2+-exporting ATPase